MEFIERRRPFEPCDDFTRHWWDSDHQRSESHWYVQVLNDGVEVARVEFDDKLNVGRLPDYDAPDLGPVALEIQLFEVSSRYRRRGIGTKVVAELAARNPERRLVGFSEADAFWESLGWLRFDDLDRRNGRPQHGRSLFIRPEGAAAAGEVGVT